MWHRFLADLTVKGLLALILVAAVSIVFVVQRPPLSSDAFVGLVGAALGYWFGSKGVEPEA